MKICNKHYSTYLCLDANIFVIPTLEDLCGGQHKSSMVIRSSWESADLAV